MNRNETENKKKRQGALVAADSGTQRRIVQGRIDGGKPFVVKHAVKKKPVELSSDQVVSRLRVQSSYTVVVDGAPHQIVQKHLELYPGPVDVVFDAEELLEEGYTRVKLIEVLWRPFKIHNISKDQMGSLIEHTRRGFKVKRRGLVLPKELLALAVLNFVDERRLNPAVSSFFKSKYLPKLSMGRRSCAAKFLAERGYIVEHGNCWLRTKKKFDQQDFMVSNGQSEQTSGHEKRSLDPCTS